MGTLARLAALRPTAKITIRGVEFTPAPLTAAQAERIAGLWPLAGPPIENGVANESCPVYRKRLSDWGRRVNRACLAVSLGWECAGGGTASAASDAAVLQSCADEIAGAFTDGELASLLKAMKDAGSSASAGDSVPNS